MKVPGLRHNGIPRLNPSVVGTLLVLALLVAPGIVRSQQWSEPFRPPNFPVVEVQWRVYGLDTKTEQNVFEWVFSSLADTAVAFNYLIGTNRGEIRTGRISFKPRKRQLSGWLFSGDSLTRIEVDRRSFETRN